MKIIVFCLLFTMGSSGSKNCPTVFNLKHMGWNTWFGTITFPHVAETSTISFIVTFDKDIYNIKISHGDIQPVEDGNKRAYNITDYFLENKKYLEWTIFVTFNPDRPVPRIASVTFNNAYRFKCL